MQIVRSIIDIIASTLNKHRMWLVDCRAVGTNGGAIRMMEISKVLKKIAAWMSGVTRWNAMVLLPSKENATTLMEQFDVTQGFENMVIHKEIYIFSCQLLGPHKSL